MPPADFRQLRDLVRYHSKLTNYGFQQKNRFQNSLTVSNIQLANVLTDTLGMRSMKIINTILENSDGPVQLESLIHGSLKKKLPELSLVVDVIFSPEQAGKIRVIMNHLDNLKTRKDGLRLLICQIAVPYSAQIDLILTTPGIKSTLSAIMNISEIGVIMEAFSSAKHLCS